MILAPTELEIRFQWPVPTAHSVDLYEQRLEAAYKKRIRWLWAKAIVCVRAAVLFSRIGGVGLFANNKYLVYPEVDVDEAVGRFDDPTGREGLAANTTLVVVEQTNRAALIGSHQTYVPTSPASNRSAQSPSIHASAKVAPEMEIEDVPPSPFPEDKGLARVELDRRPVGLQYDRND